MKKQKVFFEILISFISFLILFLSGELFWSSFGLSMFLFFGIHFFNNISKTVDIRDLLIIIPLLQWVVGPWLSYKFLTDDVFYFMAIDENLYMDFVVPAIFSFSIGLFLHITEKRINFNTLIITTTKIISKYPYLDMIFIISGLLFSKIDIFLPAGIRFLGSLIGNLHFIGIFFLFLNSKRKNKKLIFVIVIAILVLFSIMQVMFHTLLLWFVFLFMIFAVVQKFTMTKKIIIILSLLLTSVILQTIKLQYRAMVWENKTMSVTEKTTVFFSLVGENVDTDGIIYSESNMNNLISRINQGWIIAKIMYYVPKYEPYANGETINNAISSAILPRFLNPDKTISGGREKFMRFTGRNLEEGTSMGISILGEAYANYGNRGILFMFLFGFFLNGFYAIIIKKIEKTPTLLFFIPIIYLQVVKAETDFVTVLNHLVKASIFVWLVYWGLNKFLNIKL